MKKKNTDEYWYKKYVEEKFRSINKIQKTTGASLKLQAKEYKRRLKALNGEAGRLRSMQTEYLPREVFDRTIQSKDERFDRTTTQMKALSEERLGSLLKQITELHTYKTKQEGSIKVLLWLVGIGVSILIGLVIKMIATGKGL